MTKAKFSLTVVDEALKSLPFTVTINCRGRAGLRTNTARMDTSWGNERIADYVFFCSREFNMPTADANRIFSEIKAERSRHRRQLNRCRKELALRFAKIRTHGPVQDSAR